MLWRYVAKYIFMAIVLTPVIIEIYTIIVYHRIYVGGHIIDQTYYTYDEDPVIFLVFTALYAFLGVPLIFWTIAVVLVDLGLVPREWVYRRRSDKDEEQNADTLN